MSVRVIDQNGNRRCYPEATNYSVEKGTNTVHVYKVTTEDERTVYRPGGFYGKTTSEVVSKSDTEELATVFNTISVEKYDTLPHTFDGDCQKCEQMVNTAEDVGTDPVMVDSMSLNWLEEQIQNAITDYIASTKFAEVVMGIVGKYGQGYVTQWVSHSNVSLEVIKGLKSEAKKRGVSVTEMLSTFIN